MQPSSSATTATTSPSIPSLWEVWSTAARPHTLTASISPCLVAFAALSSSSSSSSSLSCGWNLKAAWLLFCLTVQLGTNLHNDYSDYVQGADDTDKRVGHARATARGWLSPTTTCRAATAILTITLISGMYLLQVTDQWHNSIAWFFILSSIFNAFAYTAGPYPLGYIGLQHWSIAYAGLGEVFVLLYFGYVAVMFLPYLLYCQQQQQQQLRLTTKDEQIVDWTNQWSLGTSVGLLATNIIIVNNLRDRHTDVLVNKKTTAVRFGKAFSLSEYVACVVLAYSCIVWDAIREASPWRLLPLVSLPMAVKEIKAVFTKEGAHLNPHVGGTAKVQFVFCILLGIACLLSAASASASAAK